MVTKDSLALFAGALLAVANPVAGWGIRNPLPMPTDATQIVPDTFGKDPVPTPAPHFDLELLKRQDDSARTCGYTSGNSRKQELFYYVFTPPNARVT